MTRFWGKLLLINFALGVATGIVQEFQFGMAWSEYSRFVGDVFGAPLAIEGLAAFFLESTFLGLWIFGWDRLPRRIHLATIWAVFVGTNLSAFFILAANAWMQRPVGAVVNPRTGRAELTSIWDVLTNKTALFAFGHTVTAAVLTAGRAARRGVGLAPLAARGPRRRAVHDVAALGAARRAGRGPGDDRRRALFGQWMTKVQPMKMAAAEALYETKTSAGLSLFALGGLEKSPTSSTSTSRCPGCCRSWPPTASTAAWRASTTSSAQYQKRYGPGDYVPVLGLTYWSFRIMIGLGFFMVAAGAGGLWLMRGAARPVGKWFARRRRSPGSSPR